MHRSTASTIVRLAGIGCLLGNASVQAQNYTITTVAGGANPYFYAGTGDGGPAISAGLATPCYDVAVDNVGNLYVTAGSLIRKIGLDQNITTFAGGGTELGDGVAATRAALSPLALAVDAANTLYIADAAFGLYRIRKVDGTGIITTVAGGGQCCDLGDGGPATSAYLSVPYGLAVDQSGNLYVAQAGSQNNLIRKVSALDGSITTVAGGGPAGALSEGDAATNAGLSHPTGVAVDLAGNLYIADAGGNRIRKVSPDGIITTVAGTGSSTTSGDGGPAVQAGISTPWHLGVDSNGNIYVTQISDMRIRLVTADGTVTTIAGNGTTGSTGDGGPAVSATLDHPAGITWVNSGDVYFAQASSSIANVRSLIPTQ